MLGRGECLPRVGAPPRRPANGRALRRPALWGSARRCGRATKIWPGFRPDQAARGMKSRVSLGRERSCPRRAREIWSSLGFLATAAWPTSDTAGGSKRTSMGSAQCVGFHRGRRRPSGVPASGTATRRGADAGAAARGARLGRLVGGPAAALAGRHRLRRLRVLAARLWRHRARGPLLWPFAYMHEEALERLPRVLDAIGFRERLPDRGVGRRVDRDRSMRGTFDDARVRGLTLIAPHFIVEDATAAGAQARQGSRSSTAISSPSSRAGMRMSISRSTAGTRRGPIPAFKREWNISEFLPGIRVPMQILQGEKDEYATAEQIEIARTACTCPVEATLMPGVGHSIFRDAPEATAAAITDFVGRALG